MYARFHLGVRHNFLATGISNLRAKAGTRDRAVIRSFYILSRFFESRSKSIRPLYHS